MATVAHHPRAWLELRRARRRADYWIAHGLEARCPWRVAELTAERERKACARSLRGVVRELRGATLPGAVPLRRAAVSPWVELLETIESRLLDGASVTAVGMLAVNTLLTSPDSCLFMENGDVESSLRRVLAKLEVR